MEDLAYINKNTLKDIENYLSLSVPPGIILAGIAGLGKKRAAKYIASKLLGCKAEELYSNPDFYSTAEDDSLKVEGIESLLKASQRCSIGQRKVYLLHHANTMSKSAQNRLLKLLEDKGHNNVLIIIAEEDTLLSTIYSRCYMIHFHPLAAASMETYLSEREVEEKYVHFLSFLLSNAPFLLNDNKDLLTDYTSMYDQLMKIKSKPEILEILHVLKEKDHRSFYENHSRYGEWNIRLVLYPFYDYLLVDVNSAEPTSNGYPGNLYTISEAFSILETGLSHLSLAKGAYTKNDYFDLLRFMVQI